MHVTHNAQGALILSIEKKRDEFSLFNWWGIERRIKLVASCVQKSIVG